MKKMTIEIDCNEKTCGKCFFIGRYHDTRLCNIYYDNLKKNESLECIRLSECIAACKTDEISREQAWDEYEASQCWDWPLPEGKKPVMPREVFYAGWEAACRAQEQENDPAPVAGEQLEVSYFDFDREVMLCNKAVKLCKDHAQNKRGVTGTIKCPKCGNNLNYSISEGSGHVHGECETKDCLSWME